MSNARLMATFKCFTWADIAKVSPFIGTGFALLIMNVVVPTHVWGPTWLRGRHGGWMVFWCMLCGAVVYNAYVTYNRMTYDSFSQLVDCSWANDVGKAYWLNKDVK